MTVTFSKLGSYGRLGNQMWQVASTIGIAKKHGVGFTFPDWQYSRYFKNSLHYGKLDAGNVETYIEKHTNYYDISLDHNKHYDLEGYFQSWKYFQDAEEEIKYYFDFNINRTNLNAVAIHVRRGDYVKYPNVHPILGLDYYRKALEIFDKDTPLYVFSDDVAWCRRYFKDGIFSDRNIIFDIASSDITSLLTMSCCDHFIIANSSFSWWAAYLGINPNRTVVAPNKWTHLKDDVIDDRLLPNWVRIQCKF